MKTNETEIEKQHYGLIELLVSILHRKNDRMIFKRDF